MSNNIWFLGSSVDLPLGRLNFNDLSKLDIQANGAIRLDREPHFQTSVKCKLDKIKSLKQNLISNDKMDDLIKLLSTSKKFNREKTSAKTSYVANLTDLEIKAALERIYQDYFSDEKESFAPALVNITNVDGYTIRVDNPNYNFPKSSKVKSTYVGTRAFIWNITKIEILPH